MLGTTATLWLRPLPYLASSPLCRSVQVRQTPAAKAPSVRSSAPTTTPTMGSHEIRPHPEAPLTAKAAD
jgi:hypothetical protein